MRIRVTDRRGRYAPREYDIQAEHEFIAYAEATERFIAENGHRARQPAERLSTYLSRFWNERLPDPKPDFIPGTPFHTAECRCPTCMLPESKDHLLGEGRR